MSSTQGSAQAGREADFRPREGVMEATVLPLGCEMLGGRGMREGAQWGGEGAAQAY